MTYFKRLEPQELHDAVYARFSTMTEACAALGVYYTNMSAFINGKRNIGAVRSDLLQFMLREWDRGNIARPDAEAKRRVRHAAHTDQAG